MTERRLGHRWAINAAFGVFALALAIVLAQAGLGFGQQLLVAVLLIVAGSQLSRLTSKSLPNFHWPMLAKGVGWVFLVAVLINSPFVQKPLEGLNWASRELGEVDVPSMMKECTDVHRVTAGDEFVLSRACGSDDVRVPPTLDPRFHISDSRFYGYFHDWVSSPWDEHDSGLLHLTVMRWPEGVNEVTVRVYTPAQGAKINKAYEESVKLDRIESVKLEQQ
jgi:hypothetical protein